VKSVLLRSVLIGISVLTLIVLLLWIADVNLMRDDGVGSLFETFPFTVLFISLGMAPIGLPLLILIIAGVTWWQTGRLSKDLSVPDTKKQLMYSVWVSTSIATSPILLSTIFFISKTMSPNSGSGEGWALIVSVMLFAWNTFLIFIVGLIARLMIKKKRLNEIPS
jgi:hypothetical protein